MVIVFDAHEAETPAGNPVAVPIPVAPLVAPFVECVMFVNTVLTHNVGVEDAALTVLFGLTVNVLDAVAVPQLPPLEVKVKVTVPV